MAPFSSETSEVPSRYLSVCNKRLAVRYRFLPAMLIEFPSDDPRDSKNARTPKLPIMRIISMITKIAIFSAILEFILRSKLLLSIFHVWKYI